MSKLIAVAILTIISLHAGPHNETARFFKSSRIETPQRVETVNHTPAKVEAVVEAPVAPQTPPPVEPVAAPQPAPAIIPPTPAPTPAVEQVWLALADCETGDSDGRPPFTARWNYNGSSGFDGGLQFLPSTWTAQAQETGYAQAWQAPLEVQIQVAKKLQAKAGWGQWPACARKLGLPY
jgi:hypothetical protein